MCLRLRLGRGLLRRFLRARRSRVGAAAMLLEGEAGVVKDGLLADVLVVAGEPQHDVRLLQKQENIKLIVKDGGIHKNLFD